MKMRSWILTVLLGGITIFVWSFIAHMGLNSLWEAQMQPLPDEAAVMQALTSLPNGMYFGNAGLFMTLFREPGQAVAVDNMGPSLLREFLGNLFEVWLLAWLLLRAGLRGLGRHAWYATLIGLAGWAAIALSDWTWHHFPFGFILLEAVDVVIGMTLAGLIIGWQLSKARPTAVSSARLAESRVA